MINFIRRTSRQFAVALANFIEPEKVYNNQFFSQMGYVDPYKPSEKRIKTDFVGIFFRGIYQRADEVSGFLQNATVERYTGQNEYEEVEISHPWAELLRNPSTLYSPAEFWQWSQLNYDLVGHADFINVFDPRNRLIELVPLFREFGEVHPLPSSRGGVDGWLFQRSDGYRTRIEANAITRIARRNPMNPYETLSLIEAARSELDEDQNMREYRKRSTKESGWESEMLTTDMELTPKQHGELAKEYKQFVGEKGRGKVAIFSHGMKPMQMIDAKDLEYIQGKIQTVEAIKDILGTKGLGEGAQTRATAEAVRYDFIESTIAPLVKLQCSQLTRGFELAFNAERGILKVRPPEMIPLDPEFELRKRRVYLETGQRILNDYLAEDGFNEVPEGNQRYIPMGWMPISQSTEPERSSLRSDIRAEQWRSVDKKKRREAAITKPEIESYFDDIERIVLKNLREKKIRAIDEAFTTPFDLDEALIKWNEKLTPEIKRMLRNGFQNVMTQAGLTGLDFSMDSPFAKSIFDSVLQRQITVPSTISNQIGDIVRQGIKDGKSNRDISGLIRGYFTDTAPGKVETITNGLSTTAWESGQYVAYHEAGIDSQEWLSSRDHAVRESHFQADGQVVGINERFKIGKAELRFPGDDSPHLDEVIGCRCQTLPRLSDEKREILQRRINERHLRSD